MPMIEARNLPRHVGIIMDGNGRWASDRGQPRSIGHREGSKAVRRIVRLSRRIGLDALTLYAFSFQNWSRPEDEVGALMSLLYDYLVTQRQELLDTQIGLDAVGELDRLPAPVRQVLDALRDETRPGAQMMLTLALSYGGREEIAAAARGLAERAAAGSLDPASIDADSFGTLLPSLRVGAPDLIIRTGGEMRISNFLLYGAAYAELYFSERLWPDFREEDLFAAIASYQRRERRFGGLGAGGKAPAPLATSSGS
jgi:undecaprenyl diphosphate synthase